MIGAIEKTIANARAHEHLAPDYRVHVDGLDITGTLKGRLTSLTHTDNRGLEADTVEIVLDDTDGKLALPSRNTELRLSIGWRGKPLADKGSYVVDEVRHTGTPDTLTLTARSADLRSGLTTQRERSWDGVSVGDVVRTLADENGLQPAIDPALAKLPLGHIDQTHESAANLLTRLARDLDAIATVKDGRLRFLPAATGRSLSGKALGVLHITRQDGDQHEFAIADRETYAGVRATYNDVDAAKKGEVIWGKVEDSAERGQPPKPAAAAAAKSTGQYKTLEKTYPSREAAVRAARKEWRRLRGNPAAKAAWAGVAAKYKDRNLSVEGTARYGQEEEDKARRRAVKRAEKDQKAGEPEPLIDRGSDNIKTLRHVYSSRANALRGASAAWRRLQRGVATFSITLAHGREDALAGAPVTVSGWKRQIDGTPWTSVKIVNTLTDSGFTTRAELEVRTAALAEE